MGLLDRLRNTPPPPPDRKPRGRSGRHHYQGFLDLEELNTDLQGQQGLEIYDRMWRTDGDAHRVLAMLFNPILGGTWTVEPYGGEDATDADRRAADLVRWALFDNMRPGLIPHLAEALPVVARSGFAPFEQLWTSADWEGKRVLVPRKLSLRLPRSIDQWHQDEYEELVAIEQLLIEGGITRLPASELVYYRVGAEGDNWEGVSLLRPVYKHWYMKDGVERLDAIAQEREAVGIPIVYPPAAGSSLDAAQLDDLEEKVAGMRAGEVGYLIMPGPKAGAGAPEGQGWLIEILGFAGGGSGGGGGRDAQPTLKYHSDKIAAALIAEFMRLGQAGEGARATADVQQDPFLASVEGFASTVVEDTLNAGLVPRIAYLNVAGIKGPPKLSMSLVDSTSLTELADYVQKLRQSEALQSDDPLEDYLRDRADLPPADADARKERKVRAATVPVPPKPGDPVDPNADPQPADPNAPPEPTKTASRQDRALRWWEQAMQLDRIEEAIDSARATFEQAGAEPGRALAKAIAATVAAGDDPDLEPPDELAAALQGKLEDLYLLGRTTVADELDAQRATTFDSGDPGIPASIARRARLAARSIVAAVAQRILGLHLAGTDDLGSLQAEGEKAASAALRSEGQVHAAPALNEGRGDEADDRSDEIAGSRYTSILDGNRCGECERADDDVLRPLNDPVRLARKPPNRDCNGGSRCRCMEFFELAEEAPASA